MFSWDLQKAVTLPDVFDQSRFEAIMAISIKVLDDHISWFGLLERLLVANMIIWVEVAAINLLALSVKLAKIERSSIKEPERHPV